jgi:hypothetical protein
MSEPALSPKELAKAKLRARAARISRMRKRVVAVSLAIFALAFGAIAYDGSMGTTTSAQTTASVSSTAGSTSSGDQTTSSDDQTGSSDDSTSSDDSSSSSSSSGSAVTTRQS